MSSAYSSGKYGSLLSSPMQERHDTDVETWLGKLQAEQLTLKKKNQKSEMDSSSGVLKGLAKKLRSVLTHMKK